MVDGVATDLLFIKAKSDPDLIEVSCMDLGICVIGLPKGDGLWQRWYVGKADRYGSSFDAESIDHVLGKSKQIHILAAS